MILAKSDLAYYHKQRIDGIEVRRESSCGIVTVFLWKDTFLHVPMLSFQVELKTCLSFP